MNKKDSINTAFRYLALILLGLFNLKLFYFVFTPLTAQPVYWILSLFDANATLLNNQLLFFSGMYASIIPACIAGSAYYLLLILNLSTPMKANTRAKSIAFIMISFLVINILRITLFASLLANGFEYFDLAHKATWYFGSTIMLVAVWFINVKVFRISNIPIYTDVMALLKDARKSR